MKLNAFFVNIKALPSESHSLSEIHDKLLSHDIPKVSNDQDTEFEFRLQTLLSNIHRILEPLQSSTKVLPDFDHTVETFPGCNVSTGKVYQMSPLELAELKRQLTEYLDKGWVHVSTSEYTVPILSVIQADGSLQLCVDYRGLRTITKKVQFPHPDIDTLLDSFEGSTISTAFDLAQGYHQLWAAEQDIIKTVFKTQHDTFEFWVMPNG